MAQIGNKINSWLNGQWAKHGRPFGKSQAAAVRRLMGRAEIKKELSISEEGLSEEMEHACDIQHDVYWAHSCYLPEDEMNYVKEDTPRLFKLEELCVVKKAA